MRNPTGALAARRTATRVAAHGAAVLGTAVLGAALLGVGPAHAAAATITATPSTVTDLQTVSVSGNAGGKNAPDLYVAVCEGPPTASNCDQSLTGFGTATAHILQVTPNQTTGAWGPVSFYVRQTLKTGHTPAGFHCTTTCVIGTTNSANPADHTYDSTSPLTFVAPTATSTSTGTAGPTATGTTTAVSTSTSTSTAPASQPAPTTAHATTTTARATTASSTSSAATTTDPAATTTGGNDVNGSATGSALADTGGSPLTPLLAGAAVALVLAGLTLRVATGRRGTHS